MQRVIHEYVDRKQYAEELMSGKLFQKLINEIKENTCKDDTGYYLQDSNEVLSYKELARMNKEKKSMIKELETNNRVDRCIAVNKYCKLYQSWAFMVKSKESEDITKQEKFETSSDLPLKLKP